MSSRSAVENSFKPVRLNSSFLWPLNRGCHKSQEGILLLGWLTVLRPLHSFWTFKNRMFTCTKDERNEKNIFERKYYSFLCWLCWPIYPHSHPFQKWSASAQVWLNMASQLSGSGGLWGAKILMLWKEAWVPRFIEHGYIARRWCTFCIWVKSYCTVSVKRS